MEDRTPKINILSETIVNKIAAGEVIERPASIVKELMENSIDAEAERIDVYLEESGKKLIRVSDNGVGMMPEDISRAILSHSTSKLKELEDVYSITTLGFRGEALPSIGAVSRVSIVSRTKESLVGAEIAVEGGKAGEVKEKGCPVGTQVEVRDLFFNTPVRRKFLKTNPVEMSHISEMMTRIALANPRIHFNLYHNGKTVFNLPGVPSFKERIITFFGGDIGKNLIPIKSKNPELTVKGYILPPTFDCKNAKMQYVFINGRYIRDKSIFFAISEAYRGMLMSSRKPIVFLFLEINPQDYDVNVHPTKIEVRFKNTSQICGQIISCIKDSLMKSEKAASPRFDLKENLFNSQDAGVKTDEGRQLKNSLVNRFNDRLNFADYRKYDTVSYQNTSYMDANKSLGVGIDGRKRTYLQVQNSYIVEEDSCGINIIDQHALHEIILFKEIQQGSEKSKLVAQQLLIPEPVELTSSEFFIIISLKDKLERLGFVIEEFGKNTIIVRSFPQILKDLDCREFFKNLLSEVDESICKDDIDDSFVKLAKITACRGAVKMGQKLKDQEIIALLEKRDKMTFTNNCPHGRPTTILMSFEELEKQFKRR